MIIMNDLAVYKYIGDGVYIGRLKDTLQNVIFTSDGVNVINVIYIDDTDKNELIKWLSR